MDSVSPPLPFSVDDTIIETTDVSIPDLGTAVDMLHRVCGALGKPEERPGQDHMAEAIEKGLKKNEPVIIRAGTGVGKSMAYLIPALTSDKRPIIVATATLALQDQLANKDLPHIRKHSEMPFNWAVLKGRSNYVCAQKIQELKTSKETAEDTPTKTTPDPLTADPAQIEKLIQWAAETTSGDRADLSFEPGPAEWGAVSTGSEECPGARHCPQGKVCFSEMARWRASSADIIVTNLHLIAANWASGGEVLPNHAAIMIDEAHELEAIVSSAFGQRLSPGGIRQASNKAGKLLANHPGPADLNRAVIELRSAIEGCPVDTRINPAVDGGPLLIALQQAELAASSLRSVLMGLPKHPETDAKRDRAVRALNDRISAITRVTHPLDTEVCWVNNGRINIAPISIRDRLAEVAWPMATPILCSATIPSSLPADLGLDDAHRIAAASPFDYATQGLLYVPRGLPAPRGKTRHAWSLAVGDHIAQILTASQGRALVLFTSWTQLRVSADMLPTLPWPVHIQGDAPKRILLQQFAEQPHSVMLATRSFWTGVDIPGAALSVVIIDKLPFPSPADPLYQARRELITKNGGDPFRSLDIPQAATTLAQGAGRLIRTQDDQGVVAVLDPRLAEAQWAAPLRAALPPFPLVRDFKPVKKLLTHINNEATIT